MQCPLLDSEDTCIHGHIPIHRHKSESESLKSVPCIESEVELHFHPVSHEFVTLKTREILPTAYNIFMFALFLFGALLCLDGTSILMEHTDTVGCPGANTE